MEKIKDDLLKLEPITISLDVVENMKYGGSSPRHQSPILRSIANFYIVTIGVLVVLAAIDFFLNKINLSIAVMLNDAMSILGFVQIGTKYYITIKLSALLLRMLDMIAKDFWSVQKSNISEYEKLQMLSMYKTVRKLSKIYVMTYVIAGTLFGGQAVMRGNKKFMIDIWIPYQDILKTSPYYEIWAFLQILFMISALFFNAVQIDSLFMLFICFLYVQLKLLQKRLLTISEDKGIETNWNILKQCVKQRNKLLRFLEYLNKFYSKIFLPMFGTNFILLTLTLFGVMAELSINEKIKLILCVVAIIVQNLAYCFGGQIIQDQATNVGHAAYNCDWIDISDSNIRKGIILVIIRSQKEIELSVGGILTLNMESFAKVMRGSFSFLTFLANTRE